VSTRTGGHRQGPRVSPRRRRSRLRTGASSRRAGATAGEPAVRLTVWRKVRTARRVTAAAPRAGHRRRTEGRRGVEGEEEKELGFE
jgi:hypothetical protein